MTKQGSRYDLLREIGRNHYSIVYDGYDSKMLRQVAVMELLPEFRTDVRRWSQIWRQTQALVNAKIENVVPIYDALEEHAWIIMEIMPGHLAAQPPSPPMSGNKVRSVLRQVLLALRAYHELGVIHGDVKPANLWYDREGFVKLSFSPGLILGGQVPQRQKDFKYLAPEMVDPQWGRLGPQTDLYCLGFTALEQLCGFEFDRHFREIGSGSADLKEAWTRWYASTEQLPSVSQLVPSAPPDLVQVIDRLIRKSSPERYPSAEAAATDLSDRPNVQISAVKALPKHPPGTLVPNDVSGGPTHVPAARAEARQPTNPRTARPTSSRVHRPMRLLRPAVVLAFIGVIAIPVLMWLLFSHSGESAAGRVLVRLLSAPTGAIVRIDNEHIEGQTPLAVRLEPGEHHVEMTLDGYRPVEETLIVAAGDDPLEWQLTLAKHTLPTPTQSVLTQFELIPAESTPVELTQTEPTRTEPIQPELAPPTAAQTKPTQAASLQSKLTSPAPTQVELAGMEPIQPELTPSRPTPLPSAPRELTPEKPAPPEATAGTSDPIAAELTPPPPESKPLLHSNPLPVSNPHPEQKPRPEMRAETGLPDGLEASGSEWHPRLKLPLRVIATRTGAAPLTLALIEPREFYFGAERPVRGELSRTTETVVVPYYLSVTEVSNQQYRTFLEQSNETADETWVTSAEELPNAGDAYPVRHVGHAQAARFCRWVSEGGRLPTEVEWELAARGGTAQPYPWGEGPDPSEQNCNLAHNGRAELMPIDAFPEAATSHGLLNILGNVAEWCEETYSAGYRDAGTPGVGTNLVIRGGSFLDNPQHTPIRVTTRSHAAEQGAPHVGFRVLIPVSQRRPSIHPPSN